MKSLPIFALCMLLAACAAPPPASFALPQDSAHLRADEHPVQVLAVDRSPAEAGKAFYPGAHRLDFQLAGTDIKRAITFQAAPCTRYYFAAEGDSAHTIKIASRESVDDCDAQAQAMRDPATLRQARLQSIELMNRGRFDPVQAPPMSDSIAAARR